MVERLTARGASLERGFFGRAENGVYGNKLVGVMYEEPVCLAVSVLHRAPSEGPTQFCSEDGS